MPNKILVVDDDEIIRDFYETYLASEGYEVMSADDGLPAVELLSAHTFDLVIADVVMPKMDGMKLLQHILGSHPLIPVVMLTAHATVERAVGAMQMGAFDYLAKPMADLPALDIAIRRALDHRRLLVENQQLRRELGGTPTFDQMVGPGPQMQRLFKLIESVSDTNANVLVTGPSGAGKELVARAIHNKSQRSGGPFISINCASVPEGLIESELFGHEKGSFTGAYRTTKGKFEAAHNGTLLLDEIGDMPLGLQAKLLRVLEQRAFERVGGVESVRVDVRLIASTNIDLQKAVEEGKFRHDLFYWLNVFPIKVPSLSERRNDIPALAHHFLRRHAKLNGRQVEQFSPAAMRYLMNAPWLGNVRELGNTIERAVIMSKGSLVELTDFFMGETPPEITDAGYTAQPASPRVDVGVEPVTLAEVEKRHILATLKALSGRRNAAAEQLDISVRTLRNKLNLYRMQGEKIDGDDDATGEEN